MPTATGMKSPCRAGGSRELTPQEQDLLKQKTFAEYTTIGTPMFGNFLQQQHENAAEGDTDFKKELETLSPKLQKLYAAHVRQRKERERTNKASCIFVCTLCFHRVRHEPVGESVTLECRIEGCRGAMNELHD